MYAVKGKAEVDRAKLVEILKEDDEDSTEIDTFTSKEEHRMITDLSKVMPADVAADVSHQLRKIVKSQNMKASIVSIL